MCCIVAQGFTSRIWKFWGSLPRQKSQPLNLAETVISDQRVEEWCACLTKCPARPSGAVSLHALSGCLATASLPCFLTSGELSTSCFASTEIKRHEFTLCSQIEIIRVRLKLVDWNLTFVGSEERTAGWSLSSLLLLLLTSADSRISSRGPCSEHLACCQRSLPSDCFTRPGGS